VPLFVRAPAFELVPERFLEAALEAEAPELVLLVALEDDFEADPRAFVDLEARAALPDSSNVWPGKITGFRNPLMRMRCAGVVPYRRAMPPIVSPRRTVCTFDRDVLLGYFSIAGSGTTRLADATAGVGMARI
jgi:hypothetical protein